MDSKKDHSFIEVDDGFQPSAPKKGPPCKFVIFGGGGDLTTRLLMPAIYNLAQAQLLDEEFSVIAVDWSESSTEILRQKFTATMQDFVERRGKNAVALEQSTWDWLMERVTFLQGSFTESSTYDKLSLLLGESNCIFYLAVAARFFSVIVDQLGNAALTVEKPDCYRRVIIEKPFGADYASAVTLNTELSKTLSEKQIYRIDHYLGKETVQNILALRFSNGMFEPLWNRQNIDHIQITAAETVGVEKRGSFYEVTGALRDMVPNHIMQLLTMIAMEAPTSFEADAVRDEKTKVLAAIAPPTAADIVRGQYTAGAIEGVAVDGYRSEGSVAAKSQTETYVAMKLQIDNWRWAGVPFYIRTGKRLAHRKTEISIHFKQAPFALFRDTPVEKLTPNIMVLHIQPKEGVTIQFSAKVPGPMVRLGGVRMNFDYSDWFTVGPSTGYETLLYDCMVGDATLFQRADNIEAGWEIVQPALNAWKDHEDPLCFYPAGTEGPYEAEELLSKTGRHWLKL
ncbi:glucose-6-phosphate dehydrogenase [Entomobacter blattae]|uniref:Glucose-6-phosphate 1-dehydrogenase n=1 Tax=Entomobacter blattae TaxID=2762277 RepID=A0A7H1NNW9_9PROT|nr:glucose-6-phosphate dehydrogenase [Entomobacter blattae]QNT77479.1 Glucose-6-phosphate 1-dehydrogenase 2 [Entomobacter blattae]